MLKKVIIQGFQSHEYTELDFNDFTNIIRGDNDSGKSAIRRAILWVLTNRPTGTSFINWDFDDKTPCSVSIHFDNHVVTKRRSRDSKVNEYVVDGEVLTAFGASVPPVVEEIFALDDTNIELQHSALFMLAESAPEMARRLNKLTNLEDIDTAYSIIRKKKNDNLKDIRTEEARKKSTEEELEKYSFVDEALPYAIQLQQHADTAMDLSKEIVDAAALLEDLQPLLNIKKCDVPIKEVGTTIYSFEQYIVEYNNINTDIEAIDKVKILEHSFIQPKQVEELRDALVIATAERLAVNQLVDDMNTIKLIVRAPIASSSIQLDSIRDAINRYLEVDMLLNDIKGTVVALEHAKDMLSIVEKEYHDIIPDECPLCGHIRSAK